MSVNDSAVLDHYRDEDRQRREKDAQRQATKRMRDRREGNVDALDLALLEEAANKRLTSLVAATWHPRCPQALLRIPLESVTELRDVWLGKEILRLQKRKPNAPSIARWIVDTERRNKSVNHAALATRVTRDLKRIAEFELIQWDDGVLLPTLDCLTELEVIPDEMIRAKSAAITP
ncbi:hypothetical protein [Parasphingorhabdus flavimaris]|uniref:hypothetical protein n=1 Tax=Parasphingorhabdus flavimaris TaxID=266812 RepID=UPI00300135B6